MEGKTEITVEQALHGYSNGHSLLANSCELNNVERRALLFMSDLSGPLTKREFESYITGYSIPGSRFYVFARTWYAFEMPRSGCAWTHSLLIDISQLGRIGRFDKLNHLFRRPSINAPLTEFSFSLKTEIEDVLRTDIFLDKNIAGLEELFMNLYSPGNAAIGISANTPKEYEAAILEIWKYQWPRLRRNFSFCSGSLNLREANGKYLDLQVVPIRDRRLSSFDNNQVIAISKDPVTWIKDYTIPNRVFSWSSEIQASFFRFMHRYGSDIEGSRSQLASLVLAYEYSIHDLAKNSIVHLIHFLYREFPLAEQARLLKTDFVVSKLQRSNKSKYEFLIALRRMEEVVALSGTRWNTKQLLLEVLQDSSISLDKKRGLLASCDEEIVHQLLSVNANSLPFALWYDIDMLTVEWLAELITLYPISIYQNEIWKSADHVQKKWLGAMEKVELIDWQKFFLFYLNLGEFTQVYWLLEKLRGRWVGMLLNWCDHRKLTRLPEFWLEYFRSQPTEFFRSISEFARYPVFCYPTIISFPFRSLKEIGIKNIEVENIIDFWVTVKSTDGRTAILVWLFTAAMKDLLYNSSYAAAKIIEPLALEFESSIEHEYVYFLKANNFYFKPDVDEKSDVWSWMFPFIGTKTFSLRGDEEVIAFFVTSIVEMRWPSTLIDSAFRTDRLFSNAVKYCTFVKRTWPLLDDLREFYSNSNTPRARLFNDLFRRKE